MSSELDDVARSLFLGHIPHIWRKLAPDTLKSLGNWMLYFLRRFSQYTYWVRAPVPSTTPAPPPRADPAHADSALQHMCVSSSSCFKTWEGAAQRGPLTGESVSAPVHLSPLDPPPSGGAHWTGRGRQHGAASDAAAPLSGHGV